MKYLKEIDNKKMFNIFKYIGPGFIVTVGFIDPGNWATNIVAGAEYGYMLLWVVFLSTIMLIILQINASKLGIVTGDCLAEGVTRHNKKVVSRLILVTVVIAIIATLVAELIGCAIAINMLFHIPVKIGVLITAIMAFAFVITNSYKRIEKVIMFLVTLIALCFVIELFMVNLDYSEIVKNTFIINVPNGSILIIMGIMGAVIMPHNLFLHSEFVQSKTFNNDTNDSIKDQIKHSRYDSIIAMTIGFFINAAILILAASTFYIVGTKVTDLSQADILLEPILGNGASTIFAIALLCAGFASSITAMISAGVVTSGMFGKNYSTNNRSTVVGIIAVTILATLAIAFIENALNGLIISQVILSIQLPITIVALISLTNNEKVMGEYNNNKTERVVLYVISFFVIILNFMLLASFIKF